MVSPLFDEQVIKKLLQYPPSVDNLPPLQSGAMQALLDMYDRKLTRAEFVDNGSKCVVLYAQLSKLYVLDNIAKLYNEGELTANSFVTAQEQLKDLIRVLSEELIETIRRMQQCPNDEDKVH